MALHTLKDFAALCGRKLAHVSQDASVDRGKIELDANKMVNDKLPKNAEYLKKWQAKMPASGEDIKILPNADKKPEKAPPAAKAMAAASTSPAPDGSPGLYALELKNKQLDADKKTEDIAILKIKKDKLLGLLIPAHMMIPLFELQRDAQTTASVDVIENMIMLFSAKRKLSDEEKATMRRECLDLINDGIAKSIDIAMAGVTQLVETFSESRGVGERK